MQQCTGIMLLNSTPARSRSGETDERALPQSSCFPAVRPAFPSSNMNSKMAVNMWDWGILSCVSCALGAHQLCYGAFIKKVQDMVQMYRDGFPVQMPKDLVERCNDVLLKVKIPRVDKDDIRFFLVAGDEPFHWGSTDSDWGSIVGLPWNFVYKTPADIQLTDIRVFGDQVVSWDTRSGKKLLETLIMTDKEQKFAIAREIHMTANYRRLISPSMFAACVICGFTAKAYLIRHPQYEKLSPTVTRSAKGAIILVCLMTFVILRDAMNLYYEKNADLRAANTAPEYYEGAVGYYAKMLQRGKAYRALMGDEGPKYFTPDGDEKRPFWHYLIVQRSHRIVDRLKQLQDNMAAHSEGD